MSSKHGYHGTPTYRSWLAMHTRCRWTKGKDYARYGGRGIKVCARWMSFPNFLEDMGDRPAGLVLERKNTDGDYNKENCHWASPKTNANNRSNNRRFACGGRCLSLVDWSIETGIPISTLRNRLLRGWSVRRTMSTPAAAKHRRKTSIN